MTCSSDRLRDRAIERLKLFTQAAPAFTLTIGNEGENGMGFDFEKVITDKAEETRKTFRALFDNTNSSGSQYSTLGVVIGP
jgi:hypothetical protein